MTPEELLNQIKVVSPEECETVDLVACCDVSHFEDDVWTTCAFCGRSICHRPHAPKSPPKVCLICVGAVCKGLNEDGVKGVTYE